MGHIGDCPYSDEISIVVRADNATKIEGKYMKWVHKILISIIFLSGTLAQADWFDTQWTGSCEHVVPDKATIDVFMERVTGILNGHLTGTLNVPLEEGIRQAIEAQNKSHTRIEAEVFKTLSSSAMQALTQQWLVKQCLKRDRTGQGYNLTPTETAQYESFLGTRRAFGVGADVYFRSFCGDFLDPYLQFLRSRGAIYDSEGDLDIEQVDLSKARMTEPNSKLATAIALLFSPKFANALMCRCNEDVVVAGKWAVPAAPEYQIRKLSTWEDNVRQNIQYFKNDLEEFMRSASSGSTYVNLMNGRLWELLGFERGYQGSTSPELAAVAAYNRMLTSREALKKLGVAPEMRTELNKIIAAANNFEMQALNDGLTKLNNARIFAVASLFVLPAMWLAPILVAHVAPFMGPVVLGAVAASSAKLALFPLGIGIGLSSINAYIDAKTSTPPGSYLCRLAEEMAATAAPAGTIAPALALLPVLPAAAAGGANYATGSLVWGTNTYGGTNIAMALGFLGSMGCSGATSLQACKRHLEEAETLYKAARTDAEVAQSWTKMGEGYRACAEAGIDLSFAGIGAAGFLSSAKLAVQRRGEFEVKRQNFENKLEQNWERFTANVINRLPNEYDTATMSTVPTAQPGKTGLGDFKQGFQSILSFLKSKAEFGRYMERLSREVNLRIEQKNVDTSALTPEVLNQLRMQEMLNVLRVYEKREGFGTPRDLDRRLEISEFLAMLRSGHLFNDGIFRNVNRMTGNPHAEYTHRVQWTLVMMKMDDIRITDPNHFGGRRAVDYFKKMGDVEMLKELDYSATGIEMNGELGVEGEIRREGFQSLWSVLFDSRGMDFTSPEYTRSAHPFFELESR